MCLWGVYVCMCMYVCMYISVWFLVIQVSFEKLKYDYNQTRVKDVIGVSSYINAVKGRLELFLCKLLWYWSSRWFFRFLVSFEKLKSDCIQTWFKDAIGVPSYIYVNGSKVMLSYFYASYYDNIIRVQVGWSPIPSKLYL